ncbi:MAG: bifunctional serine/threonine-protein kinase/formylglycine-generating enzyme family protein [Dokdonella sp.]
MIAIDIPGYLLQRTIGVGGMASVYLAIQLSLDREVALKVMAPALAADASFSKRFLQEARMLASLAHPNIVQVFDVGVSPAHLNYFSMQHLPRGDFAQRVRAGISERDLVRVLEGVANALGYAHQRGYVHRDVAPGNILFDLNDTPVLTDFGIARAISQTARNTSAGISIGTSHYMSPEQARGSDVDARSDIYALGVLAWYGLVGKPPYDGADGFAISYAHVFEPIPRLPARHAHWQPLIDTALAKTPDERFASTDDFIAALTSISATRIIAVPAQVIAAARPAAGVAEPRHSATPMSPLPIDASQPAVAQAEVSAAPPASTSDRGRRWVAPSIGVLGVALMAWVAWALLASGGRDNTATALTPASGGVAVTQPAMAAATSPIVAPAIPADSGDSEALADAAAPMESTDAAEPLDLSTVATVIDPAVDLVRKARVDLANHRLTTPPDANAFERFSLALRINGKSASALQGVLDTARAYMDLAEKSWAAGEMVEFAGYLDKAVSVASSLPQGADIAAAARTRRRSAINDLSAAADTAALAWDKAAASSGYNNVLLIDPANAHARSALAGVAAIGKQGFAFRDSLPGNRRGPELVVIAKDVAMQRTPVTRAEFAHWWRVVGKTEFGDKLLSCRDRESVFRSSRKRDWQEPGIVQDDRHPVVCVSFAQAEAYARWMSAQTRHRYRLPAAQEWRRLANQLPPGTCRSANLADAAYKRAYDSRTGASCDDGFAATSPVGQFPAVGGISDLDGNVREWVAVCGKEAALVAGCREHGTRGRGWASVADKEDVLAIDSYANDVSLNTVGFRLVRELDARE